MAGLKAATTRRGMTGLKTRPYKEKG